MENKTNGLSIGGMVVGIISLLVSFIPCVGVFGGLLAVVGLILSFIGFRSAKDAGGPTTMAIVGMALSGLAIIIAIAWGTFLAKASSGATTPLDVETCEEVLAEMERTMKDVKSIEEKGDDAGFGDISTMVNATTRMIAIQKAAAEMNCSEDPEFKLKMEELEEHLD